MEFAPIEPHQDAAMAAIVRAALKEHDLDKPGTAYFDASLDSLSAYYDRPGRAYYVLLDGETVVGGVGVAEFDDLPGGCELQKLYLAPALRSQGLGSRMIRFIEDRAQSWAIDRSTSRPIPPLERPSAPTSAPATAPSPAPPPSSTPPWTDFT